MTATRVIDGILQVQPASQDRWQSAPDKLQRAFMAASALTREEFNLVFCTSFTMDTMRPRIIQTEGGVIDAAKVVHVEAVEEIDTQLFRFYVVSDRREFIFTSSNQGKLQEIRRRLIGFIWPNADVFDPSKNNTALDLQA